MDLSQVRRSRRKTASKHENGIKESSQPAKAERPSIEKQCKELNTRFQQYISKLNLETASFASQSLVEFEVLPSTDLFPDTFSQCFELIKATSSADYKASSLGWHPKEKSKEMLDKNMWYLLVRQSLAPLSSNGSSATPSPPRDQSPGSSVLGFLSFMFTHDDPPYENNAVVYIYEVHLSERLRGAGIGSYLIKTMEEATAWLGLKKLMLTVFTSNEGARRLYDRLGFTKDQCSPPDREVRGRVIQADYLILSKIFGEEEDANE